MGGGVGQVLLAPGQGSHPVPPTMHTVVFSLPKISELQHGHELEKCSVVKEKVSLFET